MHEPKLLLTLYRFKQITDNVLLGNWCDFPEVAQQILCRGVSFSPFL